MSMWKSFMEKRQLGRSGLEISPIMLGGNVFGWTVDEQTSFEILDAFVDSGFNAIDTSDAYSVWVPGHAGGESERVIGKWIAARGRRERIVLATKVGARALPAESAKRQGDWSPDLSANYIVESVERSLRRLRTDYIDLYQAHVDDISTPMDETLEAFGKLVRDGKVRAIGASNFAAPRLAAALHASEVGSHARYNSCQPCFNLLDRDQVEAGLQRLCADNHVGMLCYSALAKGFLSGRYRTVQAARGVEWEAYLQAYLDERGFRTLTALDEVARQHCSTPGQVAVSWLLAQPAVAAAIVAVNTVAELGEILGSTEIALDQEQIDGLSSVAAS
jgi:aryl-alcohol dehydrogenase-like predicted oxidoreductase